MVLISRRATAYHRLLALILPDQSRPMPELESLKSFAVERLTAPAVAQLSVLALTSRYYAVVRLYFAFSQSNYVNLKLLGCNHHQLKSVAQIIQLLKVPRLPLSVVPYQTGYQSTLEQSLVNDH